MGIIHSLKSGHWGFPIFCKTVNVGVTEEVFVCVVLVSEGVNGVVAWCVNAEGVVREGLEEWGFFI